MNYYMMKAKLKNPKVLTATVATVFLLGLAVGHATTPTPAPTPVVESVAVGMIDSKNLTAETCQTDTECHIAEALVFYDDYQPSTSIPIIEPVDCEVGDKECEQSNKRNAGKPAMYPTICEPYIFGDVEQKEC